MPRRDQTPPNQQPGAIEAQPTKIETQPSENKTQPRRTRSVEVRAALIDAAVAVLEQDGLAALTVRAVAAKAGVAPMGVYNHLEGKDGLIIAVLERGFDALREAVTIRPGRPAIERFMASGAGYRRFALDNPVTYDLMFTGGVSPEIHERLTPHAEPALGALVDLVAQCQQEGTLRSGDPMLLALQIWGAVHGAVSLELAGAIPVMDEAEGVYFGLLETLKHGLAPRA